MVILKCNTIIIPLAAKLVSKYFYMNDILLNVDRHVAMETHHHKKSVGKHSGGDLIFRLFWNYITDKEHQNLWLVQLENSPFQEMVLNSSTIIDISI